MPKQSLLSVHASIGGDISSKSIISGIKFPEGSNIGIQLVNSSDGLTYLASGLTNVKFTADASGTFTTSELCYLSTTKGKLYAYYPFSDFGDNKQSFSTIPISIKSDAQTGLDIDYMYATPLDSEPNLVYDDNSEVNLTMNHATTQVSILLYKDNYSGAGSLTSFSIEDNGVTNHIITDKTSDNDLMMNIVSGSITGGVKGILTRTLQVPLTLQSQSVDPEFPSSNLTVLKNQVDIYGVTALLVPTSTIAPGDIKFGFKIDGNQFYVNNTSEIKWERGKQYIYKVKLSGSLLKISSVTIVEWQPVLGDQINIQ